jgi:hypothetical protein
MSDICETWSLPWHELQRKLAMGFGAETAVLTAAQKASRARPHAAMTNSWLSRAQRGIGGSLPEVFSRERYSI